MNKNKDVLIPKKNRDKFINQSNTISLSSINSQSAMALKIITYGLYLLDKDFNLSKLKEKIKDISIISKPAFDEETLNLCTISVSTPQFCEDLGITDGGKQRRLIEKAIDQAFQEEIKIKESGYTKWLHWFMEASYYAPEGSDYKPMNINFNSDGNIELTYNPKVLALALDNENNYSHIELKAIGQLKSIYAIKWFEIIKSRYNMKGRYGYAPNTWGTESMTISELRDLFKISPNLYKNRVNNLITKVVENPIKELNEAHLNFKVEVNYKRAAHNRIISFNLLCTESYSPRIPEKNSTRETKLILEEKDSIEAEIRYMKEKYPEDFSVYLKKFREEKSITVF